MQNVPVVENADGRRRAAAGVSAPVIITDVNRVLTVAEFVNAGGQIHCQVTASSGSIDVALPAAATVKGYSLTLFKLNGGATVALLATNDDTIEGSSANRRYQNATNERACVVVFSNGAQWSVVSQKGTWIVNNA